MTKLYVTLVVLSISLSAQAQSVLINEVVTDPQTDWSTNDFDGTDGGGTVSGGVDEWIELYITQDDLDLTDWTIELLDGSDVIGDLTSSGAFDESVYFSNSGGTFTATKAGDYLVLGNVDGSGAMNNSITITLKDDIGTIVNSITLGGGSPNAPNGDASDIYTESLSRIPDGISTGVDEDDFVQTQSTLGRSNSPSGNVSINEVVTDPQTDWSTNGFDGTDGGGTVSQGVDEWVELYISTDSLDLTRWTIELNDGSNVVDELKAAFDASNYVSANGGVFTQTRSGDYLVLGNVKGSGSMTNNITILLKDPLGSIVDQVILGGGSPNAPNGNVSDQKDESICRIADGVDTDIDENDFMQTRSTLGAANSPLGNVVINEIVTDPQQDWSSTDFTSSPGGSGGSNDEWVELFIATDGLNLTGWEIQLVDGSDVTGDLSSSGAFDESNYISSQGGTFIDTKVGDYLVLGNVDGSGAVNDDALILLIHSSGDTIDRVQLGGGSGEAPGGNAINTDDESISRIPNGTDTENDENDFKATMATIGAANVFVNSLDPKAGSGYALNFDASSLERVEINNSSDFDNIDTEFSLLAWCNPSTLTGDHQVVSKFDNDTQNSFYLKLTSTNVIGMLTQSDDTEVTVTAGSALTTGAWSQLALIADGTTLKLYINGLEVGSSSYDGTVNVSNADLVIADYEAASSFEEPFHGEIDEVSVWNDALSESELRALMCQKITNSHPKYANLIAYYTFDENIRSTLNDLKGDNDGNLVNTPTWVYSGAAIGDESVNNYPVSANWTGQSVSLTASSRGDMLIDSVIGSPDGIHLYQIGDTLNSKEGLYANEDFTIDSYWGVYVVNGSSPTYNLEWDYSAYIEAVTGENNLLLQLRDNNADLIWDLETVGRDKISNTIASSALSSSGEYVTFSSSAPNSSLGSGDFASASNWLYGVPVAQHQVSIETGHAITMSTDLAFSGLTIEDGGSLDIGSNILSICDSTITLNGNSAVDLLDGTVVFNKSGSQTIAGLDYGNLTVDSAGTKTVASRANVYGKLELNSASTVLNANGNLTLKSNVDGTAALGQVPAGATINGSTNVERFVQAGTRSWWHIASPIAGTTAADWMEEFAITGEFTDSSDLNGSNFPSVKWYDETDTASSINEGWINFPESSVTEEIVVGRGYRAFMRVDASTALGDTTIALTGAMNYGDVSIPVSYTSNGDWDLDAAGWNFVGNPYPSTIDWDNAGWTKTNINNAIYVWEAPLRRYRTYVDGVGTNGGTSEIAAGQAFWVRANAASPELAITESVKATDEVTLLRTEEQQALFVTVTNGVSSSNTILRFKQGASDSFDERYDAYYFGGSHVVDICSYDNDYTYFSVNTHADEVEQEEIKLYVIHPEVENEFSLHFTGVNTIPYSLFLLDAYDGSLTEIIEDMDYVFNYDGSSATNGATRFSIVKQASVSGLYDVLLNTVSIYPNPLQSKNELEIIVTEQSMLAIHDLSGKEVFIHQCTPGRAILNPMLEKGIYAVEVSGTQTHRQLLIVE